MTRAYDAASAEEEKKALLKRLTELHPKNNDFMHKLQRIPSVPRELHHEVGRASPEMLENREIAMAAVLAQGRLIQYFCEALREDAEVALAAIDSEPSAFEFLGDSLRSDKAVLLAALKSFPHALMWAADNLRNDREVILKAVDVDGNALEHASVELRADKEVVFRAVDQWGHALAFASDELRSSEEVVLAAVKSVGAWCRPLCDGDLRLLADITMEDGSGFQHALDEVRGDRDIALRIVEEEWIALADVSDELQADPKIVRAALRQFGGALLFASDDLRADEGIVLEAVKQSGTALEYAAKELRMDKEFILRAARSCATDEEAKRCYHQALSRGQCFANFEDFQKVARCGLAVPGQEAPILSVTLSQMCEDSSSEINKSNSSNNSTNNSSNSSSNSKNKGNSQNFRCEATLLSGSTFEVEVAGTSPDLTVNNLAEHLLVELPKHVEARGIEYVFITFLKGDGEFASVTAWDWDRPLTDFLNCGALHASARLS